MDSKEKSLFTRCDSTFPAERANAVELLYAHLTRAGRTFRGIIAEFEQLESENARLRAINEKWRQFFVSWQAVMAWLRYLREWIAFNRKRAAVGAAVLVSGAVVFNFYGPGTGPAAVAAREAMQRGLQELATRWTWGEGETEPRVYMVGGRALWVIGRGDSETASHADAFGQPVEVHCIHLYAKPAVSDSGAYLKPASRISPEGWFSWREQVTDCKATRKADK
jgi:hypothetical protein